MFSANSSQVSEDRLYVEDVFSTYLYSGTSSNQTISNGIDLAGKGGLVWIKCRNSANNPGLYDTARGVRNALRTSDTSAQYTASVGADFTAFNSNGFSVSGTTEYTDVNVSGSNLASWTFRKAPKFFDVVTYTGDGTANRSIAHNLGVAPGCIIVKRTDTTSAWSVYHRSLGAGTNGLLNLNLNTTGATFDSGLFPSAASSTDFKVNQYSGVNASGGTYVAYLFAHDTTSDGIIQCGSFTTDASKNIVGGAINLGWEPQWFLIKRTDTTGSWITVDNMRGWGSGTANSAFLFPNTSGAEDAGGDRMNFTPNGLGASGYPSASATYIYIAIRRGPMRTPTSGTSVFAPIVYTGNATSGTARTTGFVTDTVWSQQRTGAANPAAYDRLRGSARYLSQSLANAEVTQSGTDLGVSGFDTNNGYLAGADQTQSGINFNGYTYVNWAWRRAPSFYDQVCYTGTETNRSVNHSLGVVPELIIVKQRDTSKAWTVYSSGILNTEYLVFNSTAAKATAATYWNSTTATSTTFSLGTSTVVNSANSPYVAYLFASCPGVSKVGTYTGNGSSQTINCGFAAGARFVLIKRTDSTGDWYVFDTARGMTTLTDPYLRLNSTAAETSTLGAVTTTSVGFSVNASILAAINTSGASYIFLAIA